ncbi:hypothetical protein GXM_04818 [Nostoc sphaeroides CCNUC1]|uniref:Uncharacterized protein n=1 Tax=Nostoc sphaeroides CCNUC1 TaxID=2653204 RepID=A0A5P8W3L0_9NOSO|nr:hypothetical protein GXM_04818 [Nostoc sphaeroides CCNUC1]
MEILTSEAGMGKGMRGQGEQGRQGRQGKKNYLLINLPMPHSPLPTPHSLLWSLNNRF